MLIDAPSKEYIEVPLTPDALLAPREQLQALAIKSMARAITMYPEVVLAYRPDVNVDKRLFVISFRNDKDVIHGFIVPIVGERGDYGVVLPNGIVFPVGTNYGNTGWRVNSFLHVENTSLRAKDGSVHFLPGNIANPYIRIPLLHSLHPSIGIVDYVDDYGIGRGLVQPGASIQIRSVPNAVEDMSSLIREVGDQYDQRVGNFQASK